MAFTLRVQNFRGLRRVEWSPSGVCALVGPNGSGKTTLIDALQFLQDAVIRGFPIAVEEHGGAYGLRHFAAPPDQPACLELQVGSISWTFIPHVQASPGGMLLTFSERLSDGTSKLIEKSQVSTNEDRPLSSMLALEQSPGLQQFTTLLHNYRHYRGYTLSGLRREGSRLGGDLKLSANGRNLFTVLMNWRNRRDSRERWEFVTNSMRLCFPEIFAEFSFPIAANIVACEVHTPSDDTLTPPLLSDGFLVALLHLCAVASTSPGWAIAIDEPENALHPYAIRRLTEAFRSWSDRHNVTVLMATHSPVILDTFKDLPDKIYVLERGHEVLPVPLDQIKSRNWLGHFSLGDLYQHLKYGAPVGLDEE